MENLLIKMTFKVRPLRKIAILLYYFLSFSVEIFNYLQQVEFFAQNGPWVFLRLALSFFKTPQKNACCRYICVQDLTLRIHRVSCESWRFLMLKRVKASRWRRRPPAGQSRTGQSGWIFQQPEIRPEHLKNNTKILRLTYEIHTVLWWTRKGETSCYCLSTNFCVSLSYCGCDLVTSNPLEQTWQITPWWKERFYMTGFCLDPMPLG